MEKASLTTIEVYHRLEELADPQYQKFHSGLLPGVENVLGVRVPDLRKLAKEIAMGDWQTFLKENDRRFYECDMLQGLVIGYAKIDFETRFSYIKSFVPRIHNWAVCDMCCSSFKEAKQHRAEVWEFLKPYLSSGEEYEIRFGVVMLLSHFIDAEYVQKAFAAFDGITSEAYYVRMAVAWAISVYFVHFREETFAYLKNNQLDDWTYNKALQKIVESYRVDAETKQVIRGMKRR